MPAKTFFFPNHSTLATLLTRCREITSSLVVYIIIFFKLNIYLFLIKLNELAKSFCLFLINVSKIKIL